MKDVCAEEVNSLITGASKVGIARGDNYHQLQQWHMAMAEEMNRLDKGGKTAIAVGDGNSSGDIIMLDDLDENVGVNDGGITYLHPVKMRNLNCRENTDGKMNVVSPECEI